MKTVNRDLLLEKAQTIIDARVDPFEADWLYAFLPSVRDHDEQLELFEVAPEAPFVGEMFSYLSPGAIPIYEGVFSRNDEVMRLDSFTKGAVCVTNLYSPNVAQWAGTLIEKQVELMVEKQAYPAIDERFLESYVDVLLATLCNEEFSTWRDLLSYSTGVWWLMGLSKGTSKKVKRSGLTYEKTIFDLVLTRAKLGTTEIY